MGKKWIGLTLLICMLIICISPTEPVQAKTKTEAIVTVDSKNVTKKTVSLEVGKSVKLKVKAPSIKEVTYHSMTSSIATVSKNGKVRAKKKGTVKISIEVKTKKNVLIKTWLKVKVTEPKSSKILVAYFSRAGENYDVGVVTKGNTQIIAEMIAKQTEAELFCIDTIKSYPEGYEDCKKVVQEEIAENARPELKNTVKDMEQYDTVFIGYPIWYGDMPMAVYTFLESYDFSGKTIIPFCTHEGSGLSGTQETISKICKVSVMKKGLAIIGSIAQNDRNKAKKQVDTWLSDLGF